MGAAVSRHADHRGGHAEGILGPAGAGDTEQPLRIWVRVVKAARWADPPAIKRVFGSAAIPRDGRVVFDIGGNKYRLVAWIIYEYGIVYVRFIGSHRDYDAIDAQTV